MEQHFNRPYIQFIGTQRSGSNLLRVMLNQLPDVSAPHPPHILKTFFPLLDNYYDLQSDLSFKQLVVDVCDWVNNNPVKWEGCILDPAAILSASKNRSLVEIFRLIYEAKAVQDGATMWCCKSMESVNYFKEIESEGLHPYYLHIYRDGRDVAASFLKAIVGPKHIYFLAEKWAEEQELSLKIREVVGESRFISVAYEELIKNPKTILKEICARLELRFDESMFEYYTSKESLNTAESGKMWQNLSKPILKDNHDKFLNELTEEEIRIFESVAGNTLKKLGYRAIVESKDLIMKFTPEQIAKYKQDAVERTKMVMQTASEVEIQKRLPQDNILSSIKSRKQITYEV